MNNLVPTTPRPFSDLELVPLQRYIPEATPLERLFAALYRQRIVILSALGIALLVGALLSLTAARQYTAVAAVQLDQLTPQIVSNEELDPQPGEREAERFLQTQLDRTRTRSIAQLVENRLRLANSPAARGALNIEATDTEAARQQVIEALQSNVHVSLGLNTRVAQVSFTSGDPYVSARIANGFADALVASNIDTKAQTAARAKQYLLGQLGKAKERLESSERQMLAYARSADLTNTVATARDGGGSLRTQQLGLLTDSLAQATARRVDAQQHWAQVAGTSPLALPEVQGNQAIQALISQKAQLQAALEEDRQRHTDEYPSIRETVAKIKELDGQIAGFAGNIKRSVEGRYIAAAQQEQQMAQTVSRLRGAAMSERERSVGFNSLSREVETNKAFYDGLLQRYKQVAVASGAAAANVSIIDRAFPPSDPDSPHVVRNMALASTVGLIFAFFFGAIRERMHNVIRSSENLERDFNLPALGVVPKLTGPKRIEIALQDPGSAQSEAYHSIAVSLQQACSGMLPRTLLLTSSTASEGKSTTARGLAQSLGGMGKRVLLVDADLRRAASALAIGFSSRPGFSDVLAGTATVKSIVEQDEESGIGIVHAGRVKSSPVSLLAAEHLKSIFDQLAEDFDIVIVDGPPVMGLADAVLLARSVEAVLVVVEANRTFSTELDLAVSRLPESNIIGGIITKFDPRAAGVRYGSYDYYTYSQHADG